MANRTDPDRVATDRGGADSDRANNPSEPADPQVIDEAADRPVHEGRNFPSGGGSGSGRPDPRGSEGEAAGGGGG
jgi:hypothetical protein